MIWPAWYNEIMKTHPREFIIKALKEALLILAIAGCLAFVSNAFRPNGIDLFKGPPVPSEQTSIGQGNESEGITLISIEEAVNDFKQQSALFLDARTAEDYALGHIAGSISFPDRRFDDLIGEFLEKTPADVKLITYCQGERCALSKDLAEKLTLAGYENVHILVDGWGQWNRLELPVEKD